MKQNNEPDDIVKRGRGNQSNSASWSAAYNRYEKKYVARLLFSSAGGCWESMYVISKETFDSLGTFDNDDYKSERLIRKGKLLYKYENERNYPEPTEIIYNDNYLILCGMLLEE